MASDKSKLAYWMGKTGGRTNAAYTLMKESKNAAAGRGPGERSLKSSASFAGAKTSASTVIRSHPTASPAPKATGAYHAAGARGAIHMTPFELANSSNPAYVAVPFAGMAAGVAIPAAVGAMAGSAAVTAALPAVGAAAGLASRFVGKSSSAVGSRVGAVGSRVGQAISPAARAANKAAAAQAARKAAIASKSAATKAANQAAKTKAATSKGQTANALNLGGYWNQTNSSFGAPH